MKIEIAAEELRKRSVLVCTPMYGGRCDGIYTKSSLALIKRALQHGVEIDFHFVFNESLITRARNYCVDEFLRGHWTHLMFIDSDIGYSADDVLVLLALMEEDSPYDVMCGPYPKKTIAWEKVYEAAKLDELSLIHI